MYLSIVAGFLPALVLWTLLLIFGVKTYRSCRLDSLPWLGIYFLVSFGSSFGSPLLTGQAIDSMAMDVPLFGWTLGELQVTLIHVRTFLWSSARLVLVVLVLSDIAFLLSKAGVAVEWGVLNRLIRVRERSTAWGLVMLIPLLLEPALSLVLYLYYV